MVITEQIREYVQRLPTPFQAEVLNFVEFLLSKIDYETTEQHDPDWVNLSLAMAMRGMEDEDSPIYTTADLKVVFS